MRALTPIGLLDAWERGQGEGPTLRALALLAAACPETPWEELCALPLGERDRRLLAVREGTLGRRIESVARCPGCGEPLDVTLDTRELRGGGSDGEGEGEVPAGGELRRDGALTLRFRLPNSLDLLAAEHCADVEEGRRKLAERCVVEARKDGEPFPAGVPASLDEADVAALAAALDAADPGAELLLELRCPACGHGWRELLDVATFLWAEVEVQARRLLREVHVLARAYGWREPDVLALNPRRRRLYLEMVTA
jgi:hypothetical protein